MNTPHPRFGEEWQYYTRLIATDYLNHQTAKNVLRLAKAWSHFCQAALGVGRLPPLRLDVLPESGDVPDIAEHEAKMAAGQVANKYFSYDNPFGNHYQMLADQIAKSGMSSFI